MNAASVTVLPRRTPPSILVVENDVRIRCLVSDELRASDFKVLEASHAEDALTVLDAVRIDLLFIALDPSGEQSGLEVARLVRMRRMPTRVILAIGDGMLAKAAAEDFGLILSKPYQTSDIVELVIRTLNWPEAPA
ncbi:response regulator [Microvirga zambiensis]|uniref:response regulator n=1 Tax=Microvirga zambiensis TaxID=1402137 RepID=UPI00191F136B|nr:response regulator [Microvirga zambiensis]